MSFKCTPVEGKILREMFRHSRTAWGSGITESLLADYLGMEREELRPQVESLIRQKLATKVPRAYGAIPPLLRLTDVAAGLLEKRHPPAKLSTATGAPAWPNAS